MKLHVKSLLLSGAFALLITSVPTPAAAYVLYRCEDGRALKWRQLNVPPIPRFTIDTRNIPVGTAANNDVFEAAYAWNQAPGLKHVFNVRNCDGSAADCTAQDRDGRHHIWHNPSMTGAGFTPVIYDEALCTILDSDIVVGPNLAVGARACDANPDQWGHRTTIIHEMGHVLGLDHEDDQMALMMTRDGEGLYCGPWAAYPHPDDMEGARLNYPETQSVKDLGASGYHRAGSDNTVLNVTPGTSTLCPGQTFTFRWSVGNLGTQSLTYNIRFYLSTNSTISTSDLYVGGTTNLSVNVNAFMWRDRTITIPSTAVRGTTYFFGYVADWGNVHAESIESNNSTYLARRIRVCP